MRTASNDHAKGDELPGVLGPAMLDRQARKVDIVMLDDNFTTRWPRVFDRVDVCEAANLDRLSMAPLMLEGSSGDFSQASFLPKARNSAGLESPIAADTRSSVP